MGLHPARALLRELPISAPREAAKLAAGKGEAAQLIASLVAESGVGLPDDESWAMYGLVHPIDLSTRDRAAWKKRVGTQAFDQLSREVFEAQSLETVREALQKYRGVVPTGGLLSLLSRGWKRGEASAPVPPAVLSELQLDLSRLRASQA